MLQKTRGIVLNSLKFKESSLIVKIYTEKYGIQSFLIHGVRTKKPKFSPALFQPLSILELIIYYKENQNLKRLSEVKCIYPFNSLNINFKKIAIGFFISELLFKCLKEENSDEQLFDFLFNSLIQLESNALNPDFHLIFLFQLSHFLGFGPSASTDLNSSIRTREIFERLESAQLNDVLEVSNIRRRELLEELLKFYSLHVEGMKDFRSVKILSELMN